MSSVCGRLGFKDAESHHESSSASSPNGSNHKSCLGSEDAQESEGDGSSGYILQSVNEEESKDVATSEPISESLNAEGEDKNLGIALQDSFSESVTVVPIIPAIKGSREKHGKSLEKMSVSWAEDVYDPTPSIVSHTRSKKQQQKSSKSRDNLKKNGKKGQKGSSSSSSSPSRGSKDKKSSSPSRSKQSRDKFGWGTQMPIVAASS